MLAAANYFSLILNEYNSTKRTIYICPQAKDHDKAVMLVRESRAA